MRSSVHGALILTVVMLAGTVVPAIAVASSDVASSESEELSADTPELSREQLEDSLAGLDAFIADAMAATGVPGVSVVVVTGDEVVQARGYGVRNTGTGEPVDAETVFQVASLSKALTSTIVASVVGDGTIDWDEPVRRANSEFELSDPWVSERVTYADLLAMRSGLPGQAGNVLESIGFDRGEILDRLRLVDLAPFRDTWSYSNFGFTAAGESAARATGMSWEDLAAERLFEPAGMTASSARYTDFINRPNRADLHVEIDGAWVPAFERMPDAQAPAGGVSSNVVDLGRWARLVLGGGQLDGRQVIDSAALARVTTPAVMRRPAAEPGGAASFYGLGWNVSTDAFGNVRWSHSGAFSTGAATTVALVPALDIGIVVLTNAQPIGLAEAIADAYLDLVETGSVSEDWVAVWRERFASVYGQPRELPEVASEAMALRPFDAYTGTFANDYAGTIEVIADDAGLAMVMGPARMTYPLTSLDADAFSYVHDPELPEFLEVVTFDFGAGDVAKSVDISAFADVGYGAFPRT